jgi:hypothetical protein
MLLLDITQAGPPRLRVTGWEMHRLEDRSQKHAVAFAAILSFLPDVGTDAGTTDAGTTDTGTTDTGTTDTGTLGASKRLLRRTPYRAIASLLKHDLFGKPMRALLRIMI